MKDTVHVKGLSELDRFLQELPVKMEKNIVRGALRAGATVLRDAARANIESVSGALATGMRLSTGSRGGRVTASVYTKAFYAQFVEYGTKPHVIRAKDGGALAVGGGLYDSVRHPGARPHPFMRPALDTRGAEAVVAAGTYIRDRLATKHGLDTAGIAVEAE